MTSTNKMTPYWQSECGRAVVYLGDNRDVLAKMEKDSAWAGIGNGIPPIPRRHAARAVRQQAGAERCSHKRPCIRTWWVPRRQRWERILAFPR